MGRSRLSDASFRENLSSSFSSLQFRFGDYSSARTSLDSEFSSNWRIGQELNFHKQEEKRRQKIQRILTGNNYQITTYKIISTNKFQYAIMSCVILNILLLVLPTMPQKTGFAQWFTRNKIPLNTVDSVFLSVYIFEMTLKIFACRKEYFRNSWDILDCTIVIFSLIDLGNNIRGSVEISNARRDTTMKAAKQFKVIRLLRATRMLRVLRTLKFVERLQRYTETIIRSLSELDAILSLTLSVLFIFAAVACSLFGEILPVRFGNIPVTVFTLLQLITLDDWYEIIQAGSYAHGSFNTPLFVFVIMYIFIMVFIIVNLLLGVLVNNFQLANDEEEIRLEQMEDMKTNSLDYLIQCDSDTENEVADRVVDEELARENKEMEQFLMERLQKTGNDGDFKNFFGHLPDTDYKLREWYYRLLPSIEKHEFLFDNQFNAFVTIVDEGLQDSEDKFTAS